LPRGKVAGACCWLSTPSTTEGKERVELYLNSPSGWTLPFYLYDLFFDVITGKWLHLPIQPCIITVDFPLIVSRVLHVTWADTALTDCDEL